MDSKSKRAAEYKKVRAFIDKWDSNFKEAFSRIIEDLKENGFWYWFSEPYSEDEDGTPSFGFSVAPSQNSPREEIVDVWARFEPIYDEDPLRYWPLLMINTYEQGEVSSTNLDDKFADLENDRQIGGIVSGLPYEWRWVAEKLKRAGVHPRGRGVKEWMPPDEGPSLGASGDREVEVFVQDLTLSAVRALQAVGREIERLDHRLYVSDPALSSGGAEWNLLIGSGNFVPSHVISVVFPSNVERPKLRIYDYRADNESPVMLFEDDVWPYPVAYRDVVEAGRVLSRIERDARLIAELFKSKAKPRSVLHWRPKS